MKTVTAALSLMMLLLPSCTDSNENSGTAGVSSEAPGPVLQSVCEIGIELGDSNYVFGIIQDVDFSSDGTIAVLDSRKKRVSVYTPSGQFLGSFGGEGEAPGEFLNPRSLACLDDGRIAVSDPFSREVELFNPDFSHSETVADFTERAPFVITAAAGGFAGEQGGFNRDEGILTQRLVYWDLGGDSICVLFEKEDDFSPENMVARFMQPQAGIVSRGEAVYFSPPVTDKYEVNVYQLNGSSADPLEYPGYSPVDKSDEDLQAEIEEFEDRVQAMAASGRGGRFAEAGYDPPEHYYATSSLGVDDRGFIWVQRGWEQGPVFDLFLPGETVPSETVTVSGEEDLSGYEFVISPYGIAAYESDPEYYPRVLILEVQWQ